MGNCLRHESEMHWADEDWDDFLAQDDEEDNHHHHSYKKTSIQASKTVIVTRDSCKSSDPPSHHEIKIRLTKKQLQDLLSKVNVHDLTGSADPDDLDRKTEEGNHNRLWRPVLQSIPEVN